MTTPIMLTIPQARDLQRSTDPWPAQWAFLLAITPPEKPDTLMDPERTTAGLAMLDLGCEDDQIAQQLGWKPDSRPLSQLRRLHKRGTHRPS